VREPRDVHANHLYVVRVTFADADEVQQALTEREHRHLDPTSCPCIC